MHLAATVPEVSANGNPFEPNRFEACEPVILRGLCAHWPIIRATKGRFDTLAEYLRATQPG